MDLKSEFHPLFLVFTPWGKKNIALGQIHKFKYNFHVIGISLFTKSVPIFSLDSFVGYVPLLEYTLSKVNL